MAFNSSGLALLRGGGFEADGGNWHSFIHHQLQRALFVVAKSAFPLATALLDDFVDRLIHLPNHRPYVTLTDPEGHVMFDVATARE
ncbi:hypothetical protein CYMTET_51933 [Cymbomonas tetramitiformis]|uniref:Uncharacterized protein n=1 Tax=Cymbomonas tetramitiformis TaxID=36881 RepID=A0AAE0BLB1_9CHLO|nr:hypothetical protein CYMTET_51933 [Cymbomonas tetramitiformis]